MLNSTQALGLAWPKVISTGSPVHTTASLALWFGPSVVNLRMAMSYLSNPMAVLVFHKSRRKNISSPGRAPHFSSGCPGQRGSDRCIPK